MNRERAEQQRRAARAGGDIPQPHGADDAAVIDRDQRQPVRRQAAFAQPLGRLGETRGAIGLVEQRLARRDVGDFFFPDGHHDPLLSAVAPRRPACPPRCGEGRGGRRSQRGQMWKVRSGAKPLKATAA